MLMPFRFPARGWERGETGICGKGVSLPSLHRRPARILTAFSVASGAAALVCGAVFCLAPKHGVAVVAAFSAIGSVALSIVAIALGVVALLYGRR